MDVRAIHTPPLTVGAPAQQQRRGTGVPAGAEPVRDEKAAGSQRHAVLSAEEERYFALLFPEDQPEHKGPQVYTGCGTRAYTRAGALVDRKG